VAVIVVVKSKFRQIQHQHGVAAELANMHGFVQKMRILAAT